ncbi:MAG TPA: ankyrin repeat domain-containing protein [Clostridiales bacterium]|nr:ankyrin repeat domain-containing protein [Clostridiales bacterium]HQP69512.1 ankyrin repeat domain-containing protein [Clostridiales bacterium]
MLKKITAALIFVVALALNGGLMDIKTAVTNGDLTLVRSMIEGDKSLLESKIDTYFTPLNLASYEGKTDIVKYLLSKGADIDTKDKEGSNPLQNAAARGHFEIVKLLVEKGSNVNYKDDNGVTPLHFGCMSGNLDIVKYLVEKGADLNATSKIGRKPAVDAVFGGNFEVLKYLESKGASMKGLEAGAGSTPLHIATGRGNIDMIKYFVSKGYDVNKKNDASQTPFTWAIGGGNTEILRLFIENGADVNFKDRLTGKTTLHFASVRGNAELADFLVKKGADVNIKDNNGKTPLFYASYYDNEIIEKLLKKSKAESIDTSSLNKGLDLTGGDAKIFYFFHSGMGVKTKDHLLIFDYFEDARAVKPTNPNINNGYVTPADIKDQNVIVFISHEHEDHFFPAVFEWAKVCKNISFVAGFDPKSDVRNLNIITGRNKLTVGGVDITTIPSTDTGVAFFVKADGISVYHSGDHANMTQDMSGPFDEEIDYLVSTCGKADIAFFPVTGCNFRDHAALKAGVKYAIEKMNPGITVPMHAWDNEIQLRLFRDEAVKEGVKAEFFCPESKGDRFIFNKKSIGMN